MKVPDEICMQIVRSVLGGAIQTIGINVTLVHLRALQEVARGHFTGELIGVTEVAKNLNLPISTASRLLAQLGDFEPGGMGFITQIKHPNDRRRVVLTPTELWEKRRKQYVSFISQEISPVIAEFCAQQKS